MTVGALAMYLGIEDYFLEAEGVSTPMVGLGLQVNTEHHNVKPADECG